MKLSGSAQEEPEVNLTSLIDVVLLLLVFFMVSTSFEKEPKLRIALPHAQSSEVAAAPQDPLEITVTAQGAYLVNKEALTNARPETLRRALRQVAGEDRSAAVVIRADAQASHQAVVTAMDVLGRLGFVNINIATTNPAPGDSRGP